MPGTMLLSVYVSSPQLDRELLRTGTTLSSLNAGRYLARGLARSGRNEIHEACTGRNPTFVYSTSLASPHVPLGALLPAVPLPRTPLSWTSAQLALFTDRFLKPSSPSPASTRSLIRCAGPQRHLTRMPFHSPCFVSPSTPLSRM